MGKKKPWQRGKGAKLENGAPPQVTPASEVVKKPAAAVVGQANFVARIAVSPSIQKSRNLTADKLQVAIDEALQKFVNFDKTITVTVSRD